MGRDDDLMTVLDAELRVRGVKGLRVADTSVMPLLNQVRHLDACTFRTTYCRSRKFMALIGYTGTHSNACIRYRRESCGSHQRNFLAFE
jgi:hypothetical protein